MAPGNDVKAVCTLLRNALVDHRSGYGAGSMSCCLYDTAWVASVSRKIGNQEVWVFPSSFKFLLDAQRADGRWSDSAIHTGEILSGLACLFSLVQHAQRPLQFRNGHNDDIHERIQRAISTLTTDIQLWDVSGAREVGFEILVPSLLDLLERAGINFDFPKRSLLNKIRDLKLSRFRPEMLYQHRSTLLHSLEAFYGDVSFDFDRIRPHRVAGSIMASPAATAAYLMRCSTWDDEAENYLHLAILNGAGKGQGSLPSAYPSAHFEITWMASTILMTGVTSQELGSELVDDLFKFLNEAQSQDAGLVGFAPGLEPDLDDTAKASITLSLLGARGLSKCLIPAFATNNHFKTYAAERNPSLTANANALHAMALDLNPGTFEVVEIKKVADFVCNTWLCSDTVPEDKWNISPLYSSMLIAYALCALLSSWSEGKIRGLDEAWLREKVLLTLMQCLIRVLSTQESNGAWRGCEETAYAMLTLSELSSLPQSEMFADQINDALARARTTVITPTEDQRFDNLWVEKVKYHSTNISKTYLAAARCASLREVKLGGPVRELYNAEIGQFIKLAEQLPLFSHCPKWVLRASWIEAQLFLPRIRALRESVFVRKGMTKDKYFEIIPFTWCASNNMKGNFVSSDFLFDMMEISFLNYQVDEFMEAVIGAQHGHRLQETRMFIDQLIATEDRLAVHNGMSRNGISSNGALKNGINEESQDEESNNDQAAYANALTMLRNFVHHICQHPHIQTAHAADRAQLRHELGIFLHAHCTQIEENLAFLSSNSDVPGAAAAPFAKARDSMKTWVRTVSSDHTSCPYSFAFMACLGGARREDGSRFFRDLQQRYVADDLCRHLAAMCRLYNDHGSLQRDRAEWNLNVANFAELHDDHAETLDRPSDEKLKSRIYAIAEYERACMDLARHRLGELIDDDVRKTLDVFINVTDLFGQIYVVKDIASKRSS